MAGQALPLILLGLLCWIPKNNKKTLHAALVRFTEILIKLSVILMIKNNFFLKGSLVCIVFPTNNTYYFCVLLLKILKL
jgi:hypothetical protein